MEAIKNITETVNRQTPKHLENQQTSLTIPKISREQFAAIFSVINLSRGTLGWAFKEAEELREQITIWAVTFNDHQIPNEHLMELWKRARDLRINRLQNGLDCPDFTAELLAACWVGANGLRAELKEREIQRGRTLTSNAESVCRHCFGSGFRTVKQGEYSGTVKCNHED